MRTSQLRTRNVTDTRPNPFLAHVRDDGRGGFVIHDLDERLRNSIHSCVDGATPREQYHASPTQHEMRGARDQ